MSCVTVRGSGGSGPTVHGSKGGIINWIHSEERRLAEIIAYEIERFTSLFPHKHKDDDHK